MEQERLLASDQAVDLGRHRTFMSRIRPRICSLQIVRHCKCTGWSSAELKVRVPLPSTVRYAEWIGTSVMFLPT